MKPRRLSVVFCGMAAVILSVGFAAFYSSTGPHDYENATSSGVILSVSRLGESDKIVVNYSTSGCFHYYTRVFELRGGDLPQLIILDGGKGWNRDGVGVYDRAPSPIGVLSLAQRDCRGLDDLFNYYRRPNRDAWSTTTNKLHLEYFHGAEKIGEENFVEMNGIESRIFLGDDDSSYARDPRMTREMVSFWLLERKALGIEDENEL